MFYKELIIHLVDSFFCSLHKSVHFL